jgi:Na+-driven multidrug efflux pump
MLLGGKGVLLEKSLTYSMIFLSGGIVVWLSGTLTAALRGIGDMRFPAMLTLASAALQTILSAGLILGLFGFPRLELVGAALSIVITGLFTALVLIIKLSCFTNSIQLKFSRITIERELFKDIFSVALPASLSPIFTVGTILILTGLIGQFGSSALAGYGIGSRVEFLMIPIVFGIGTAMTAMVGTNIGAKNITRAEKIGFTGAISAGLLSAVIGVTLALTPSLWINFFTSDQSTFLVTKQYIEILGFFYIFQGFGLSLFFASQGADAMKWPIIATILRCVITAIGAFLAVYYFSSGLAGIFYSSAIAMAFFGIMMMVSLKMGAWRKK